MFILLLFLFVYTKYDDDDVAFHYFEISYKSHFVHSPAYGYPLSLANTVRHLPVTSATLTIALSVGQNADGPKK